MFRRYFITNRKRLLHSVALLKMKTGIELIAEERKEQVEKHGYDVVHDTKFYSNNELVKSALFCIAPNFFEWPYNWSDEHREGIYGKDRVSQLKIAGALIAAEIDRLQYHNNQQKEKV